MAGLKLYRSYSFKDKDPIIDRLRTVINDEKVSYKEIEERSGVKVGTLRGWFDGATKRPQFATTMAVARSLGYDLSLVKSETKSARVLIFKPARRKAVDLGRVTG